MNSSPRTGLGLARVALLLAAALYVIGAGVGPWAHAHAAPAAQQEDGRGNLPPAGHELDCVVCHAFGAAAAPAAGDVRLPAAKPASPMPITAAAAARPLPFRAPSARAPPQA